ncbi:MAG: hypothetical protein ACOYOT_02800 [Bacteroidales bacterium]
MVSNITEEYNLTYFGDSIEMKRTDCENHEVEISKFIKKDLGYYFISKYDTTLCLTILKDTMIVNYFDDEKYMTKIEKINSNLYKSSNYFIDNKRNNHFLTSFYYDKNYKIVRYEKAWTVSFIPH